MRCVRHPRVLLCVAVLQCACLPMAQGPRRWSNQQALMHGGGCHVCDESPKPMQPTQLGLTSTWCHTSPWVGRLHPQGGGRARSTLKIVFCTFDQCVWIFVCVVPMPACSRVLLSFFLLDFTYCVFVHDTWCGVLHSCYPPRPTAGSCDVLTQAAPHLFPPLC